MTLIRTSGPDTEPVTAARVKDWLKITGSDQDDMVDEIIQSAREYVEYILQRQLMQATYELYFDEFPDEILLPRAPVQSITSVNYIATDGSDYTEFTNKSTDLISEPARIQPAYNYSWPSTKAVMNAVKVEFVAGYADADSVPERFKNAMKLYITHMFYNRGEEGYRTLPQAFFDLLSDRLSIV